MGLMVQTISYMLVVPLYLVLHLLTSPVAYPSADPTAVLAVDATDDVLIPLSSLVCFCFPAVMMCLPSPSLVSSTAHYAWDAIWQPFPATQNTLRWILKSMLPARKRGRQPAAYVYLYVVVLCVVSQVGLLAVAVTPASLVPAEWQHIFSEVTVSLAFIPYWPGTSPVVDTSQVPIVASGQAELGRLFFQYDAYCAGTALLTWALFLLRLSRPKRNLADVISEVALWVLLGGPTAAAAVVLWKRDTELHERKLRKIS